MDVIHFPDDPRPARWTRPVLALGNFDGVHRGHRKILDRVRRVATEHAATPVVMTFDPHPPRVVRPDKAPPLLMTKAQKLEAIAAAGVQGAAIVRFTQRALAVGSRDLRAGGARRLAARLRGLGGRELSLRPRSRGQLLAAAVARRPLRLQGREDRSGPLQGLRRQQHADPAAGRRGAGGRGGRAAGPSVLHRRQGRARRGARADDRIPDGEPRAPRTSCCRRTASMPRRSASTASCTRRSRT